MDVPIWVWIIFNLCVLLLVVIDLFLIHREDKAVSMKTAFSASLVWILFALVFNAGVYFYAGYKPALDFLTGYLIEKSLSIDNLFVFIMIFNYFKTPPKYQHKVLFWGILGAIVMRAGLIFFGISLVNQFHWIFYIFGIFLIFAAIKMVLPKNEEIHPENNLLIKLLKKFIPITHEYYGHKFLVKLNQVWHATPLLVVLIIVETTDLVFALDSIPAIMGITLDPFIIYTSNIFAILGLRNLYFALSSSLSLFQHLHYGISAVLAFIGAKMLLEPVITVSTPVSLLVILLILGTSVVSSIFAHKR